MGPASEARGKHLELWDSRVAAGLFWQACWKPCCWRRVEVGRSPGHQENSAWLMVLPYCAVFCSSRSAAENCRGRRGGQGEGG